MKVENLPVIVIHAVLGIVALALASIFLLFIWVAWEVIRLGYYADPRNHWLIVAGIGAGSLSFWGLWLFAQEVRRNLKNNKS